MFDYNNHDSLLSTFNHVIPSNRFHKQLSDMSAMQQY